jgi:hypothetical protein
MRDTGKQRSLPSGDGKNELTLVSAVLCVSGALDMVAPVVANHHLRVCHAALCLAREMNLPADTVEQICLAALLTTLACFPCRSGSIRWDSTAMTSSTPNSATGC